MANVTQAIKDNIRITEYAEVIGFHPIRRKGQKESWCLAEHDSLVIKLDRSGHQWFVWNSQGVSGSIIDFAMAINGWDSATAISELRQYMGGRIPTPHSHPLPDPPKKEPSPFVLPLKNSSHSRLKAYLCKTRGLDPRIVSELLKQEAIYQDSRNNVVFVGRDYDNEAKYASFRGTLSDIQFRGDVEGSNKEIGFSMNLVGQAPTRLFVCESPIDAMSVASMLEYFGRDGHSYAYLSLGGTASNALAYHLPHHPQINTIYLCQDNDEGGLKSRAACCKALEQLGYQGRLINKPPIGKDFNDDLLSLRHAQQEQTQQHIQTHSITR